MLCGEIYTPQLSLNIMGKIFYDDFLVLIKLQEIFWVCMKSLIFFGGVTCRARSFLGYKADAGAQPIL